MINRIVREANRPYLLRAKGENIKTTDVSMKDTGQEQNESSHTSWFKRFFGPPDPVISAPSPEITPTPKKPANHQKVLVVDDDPLFLKIAATHLETNGYDVVTAKDGCEAIEAVRKQKPHLVVLDVNLPQDFAGVPWDGFRVIEWLNRFDHLKNIPVVMMTSGNPSKYAREAIRAGATAFFHKRTDQNHLITMVRQTLLRRKPALATGLDTNFSI